MTIHVGIIGAGASGLMAAIIAARGKAKVTVLERRSKACGKVLASGNGKCNLTNALLKPENFHSHQLEFAWPLVKAFDNAAVREFFLGLGLLTKEEGFGRILPVTEQARAVAEVLLSEARRLGVTIEYNRAIGSVAMVGGGFEVETYEHAPFRFDQLVIATGGPSAPQHGGGLEGGHWAGMLGHRVLPMSPAIVGLLLEGSWFQALQGTRVDAGLTLESPAGNRLEERFGEILFTKTGVSGPALLEISGAVLAEIKRLNPSWETQAKKPGLVAKGMKNVQLWADFFRPFGLGGEALLAGRWKGMQSKGLAESFTGLFPDKLAPCLLSSMGYSKADLAKPVSALGEFESRRIAKAFSHWEIKVAGCRPLSEAQAVTGGVSLEDVNSQTLESRKVPGLFFCGEVLDVVGDCGGYNLQWAWSSGHAVGKGLIEH